MEQEIELKLLVDGDAAEGLQRDFIARHYRDSKLSQKDIYNQYYDTPELQLRAWRMGFRVRAVEGEYEQTLKTAGSSLGGMSARPEHNVMISEDEPDLTLFDNVAWPEDANVSQLQAQIEKVFTSHFQRQRYLLTLDDGDIVELVLDRGAIISKRLEDVISEIELELKQGKPQSLLIVAQQLLPILPYRFGIQSKAERGYRLWQGEALQSEALPSALKLHADDSVERAFDRGVRQALHHLQLHEQCYMSSGKIRDLQGVFTGVRLLQHSIALFAPALSCAQMTELQQQVDALVSKWSWNNQLQALKELRSKKGPYRKRLTQEDALQSHMTQCSNALQEAHPPAKLIMATEQVELQLKVMQVLMDKPWQQGSNTNIDSTSEAAPSELANKAENSSEDTNDDQETPLYQQSIRYFAKDQLRLLFKQATKLLQSLPLADVSQSQAMQDAVNAIYYGHFLWHEAVTEKYHQRCAPWLDLHDGIDELATLRELAQQLDSCEGFDSSKLASWCQGRQEDLLQLMEQSREAALNYD